MLQLAAGGDYPTEAVSEVNRHPAQPQTPSIGDSPIRKTPMEEAQDTENDDVDDTNENERPPQPEIQADGIQPSSRTNPDANENQRSPGSELEPKNGSTANNESLATSPKDKDSSPLSPDTDQGQFQILELIKMSLRSQVSSRPESNVRVSSSLPDRSTAFGLL